MESAYGIGVKNRYELFYDDEEDPLDILKQQEDEKAKKKELKLQEKENKQKQAPTTAKTAAKTATTTQKKKETQPAVKIQQQEQSVPKKEADNNRSRISKPPVERTAKFGNSVREENRDVEERKNRRNKEDRVQPPEFRDRGGNDRGERGGAPRESISGDGEVRRGGRGGMRGGPGGSRGRGRGGGGRGGFDNRGKREYDRQSGSDKSSSVKAFDKREGGGSHNWGTLKDDIDQLNNTELTDEPSAWADKTEETQEQGDAPKEGEPVVEGEDGEKTVVDDGPKIMTLDEYKKEQEKKRTVPRFNIRKAGEGEDTTQWKKTYVLKKKEEEEEEVEEEYEDDFARRGRPKHVVDIEINFSDSRHGRGRGGRGRGASRGLPRGLPRGGGGGTGGSGGVGGRPGGGSNEFGGTGRPDRGEAPAERLAGGSSGGGVISGGSGGGVPRGGRPSGGRGKSQSAPKVDDENDFPSLVAA